MTLHLLESAEIRRLRISRNIDKDQKSKFGQYLTSASIAKILASQFHILTGDIRLLDPGAGIGILTAAFVERIIQSPENVSSCQITAYEIEPTFHAALEQTLAECCEALTKKKIAADFSIVKQDFLSSEIEDITSPLFLSSQHIYTHSIQNPPYKKIHSHSYERKILSSAGIDTVNFYSAFVWLTMLKLENQGELVAITPRSFFNGTYYKPFRQSFLREMALDTIHVFESREEAFSDDEVLQENVIFHAIKTKNKSESVTIDISSGNGSEEAPLTRKVAYSQVVRQDDPEKFIHITLDNIGDAVKNQMEAFPSSLQELGVQVSTGPVVDFRMKDFLRSNIEPGTVPLLYPEAIKTLR